MTENTSIFDHTSALVDVATFRPKLTGGLVILSVFTAVLEGIGLTFIIPIIQLAQGDASSGGQFIEVFVVAYDLLGLPLTLETAIAGVVLVMGIRYGSSFLVSWLRIKIQEAYGRKLQRESFEYALDAKLEFYDERGSEEVLNAIVTQANQGRGVIMHVVNMLEQCLLAGVYLAVALIISPLLTFVAAVVLGGAVLLTRVVLESGFEVGGRVADANEEIQASVQAGTQGIRDVRLFGLRSEIFDRFRSSIDKYVEATVKISRNQAALENFYQFSVAITVFILIYLALTYSSLSIGGIGVFLFAIFRLGPRVSNINTLYYRVESTLPHLSRTRDFVAELENQSEPEGGEAAVPSSVRTVEFDDVHFAYSDSDEVLRGVSFSMSRDEFVAFVGPSGAGKSTIVALLARLYEPNEGEIRCNGTSIRSFDPDTWRTKLAVVRQHPHIFNESLRYNMTIGNREASRERIEEVSEIAQIDEFLDDLPNGYDTIVGDDGVKLSGGQRQRIAIARALLRDADLILLDEATSDLDTHLVKKVHGAIEGMERDAGLLVVAHRLSTVTNADRIHVVEDGEIVECGSHEDLMSREGAYAALHGTQRH